MLIPKSRNDLLGPGKCPHKRQKFIGVQECGPGIPDLDLYNCRDCGTALAREKGASNMAKRRRAVYEALPGDKVSEAAKKMVEVADKKSTVVTCEFNGIQLLARPGDDPAIIVRGFDGECERRHKEYEASPEGIAAAKKQRALAEKAATAAKEGILPFELADPDSWEECVKANDDGYGSCAVRYAARWANYMEAAMESGAPLENAAESTAHEANLEGITGFMYGCAVGILAKVWTHGEELRRWHNLDSQSGGGKA